MAVPSSSLIVVILVFVVLFSLIFYAEVSDVSIIVSQPKLTPMDAMRVVDADLKNRIDGYTDFGVYSIFGFYRLSEIREYVERFGFPDNLVIAQDDIDLGNRTIRQGDVVPLQLALFYQHPNETKFFVNSASGGIEGSCITSDECLPNKPYSDYAAGKLVYFMDIVIWDRSGNETSEYGQANSGFYLVEARSEVIYAYFY